MILSTLRPRLLPAAAWRALFLATALALPMVSPARAAEATSAAPAAATAAKKFTAPALIIEVKKGVALIGKGAKEAKIDPKSPTAAPFFAAVKTVAQNTDTLKTQLAAKDKAYFKTLSDTATAVGKIRVTAPRIGVANETLNAGTKLVLESFDALRANFGKEAARKKAGGPLTAAEKTTLGTLKSQQKDLVAKLAPVRAKAVKAGNKKLVADLDGLFKQSNLLVTAQDTVAGFILALQLFDYLSGEYDAYTYYVPLDYRTQWAYVGTSFRTAGTSYWKYYDTYTVSDWSYYETTAISYDYSSSASFSISESEVAEYDSYIEEASSAEVSEDAYIDEESYEGSYEANEDSQDTSWDDAEEDIADEADDSTDESDDSSDESDDSSDESDDSADESDDSSDDSGGE